MIGAFLRANRRFCSRYLKPRLYAVSHMGAFEHWLRNRVEALARRDALLEFGSGRDFPIAKLFGHRFTTVAATDIEAVPPEDWPPGVVFKRCTTTEVPFETGRFDTIVVRSVIEHVEEPDRVFCELARVLKPGGVVLMNLPNKWDYVSVGARLAGRFKSRILRGTRDPGWEDFPVFYRANTRRDLTTAARRAGLDVQNFRPLPSEPGYLGFFVPLYVLGAIYQFLISLLFLDFLQPAFLVILAKPDQPLPS